MKQKLDERLYAYAVAIVKFVDTLPKDQSSQIIAKQVMRSGTSVTANIREAKGASTKKDYINFYIYALKSANETEFWLQLLKDTKSVTASHLLNETKEIAKILAASVITMKKK